MSGCPALEDWKQATQSDVESHFNSQHGFRNDCSYVMTSPKLLPHQVAEDDRVEGSPRRMEKKKTGAPLSICLPYANLLTPELKRRPQQHGLSPPVMADRLCKMAHHHSQQL